MKIAIRYFSKTGNTEKLANGIAVATGVTAHTIDKPLDDDVDILFLGSSVMATKPRKEIRKFIKNIDVNVGQVVNFGTAAFIESTYPEVKKLIEKKGLIMSNQEFHCKGSFTGMHKGRPNDADVAEVNKFAQEIISH